MLHPRTEEGDERWALGQAERALLANKSGATRLGFAVLLKMFQAEGRFPRRGEDVPAAAVEAIARQVGVPAVEWRRYAWGGRTAEYHRAQIGPCVREERPAVIRPPRRNPGFREGNRPAPKSRHLKALGLRRTSVRKCSPFAGSFARRSPDPRLPLGSVRGAKGRAEVS